MPIDVPRFQHWSCHGCTACCRDTLSVELSAEEKQRIEGLDWTSPDGVEPGRMFVPEGGRYRLAHGLDGACVFLDGAGRCRIHSKFGEAAKPLACRAFPVALHPAGDRLAVSLRFSCPAVVENRGQPLTEQMGALRALSAVVVPADYHPAPPPAVLREAGLEWGDFRRYVDWLDRTLSVPETPVALKVARALHWLQAVEKASFDQATGSGADEILGALVGSAAEKLRALEPSDPAPSRFGRFLLRQWVLDCAGAPRLQDARLTSVHRWRMLWALIRFARCSGNVPAVGDFPGTARFAAVERPFGPLPAEAEAMLTRFLRVKVTGLHFCGVAAGGLPLVEGFRSLALAVPAVLWLSRWRAAADGRSSLTEADVAHGIRLVDHHRGRTQGVSLQATRRRVRLLGQRNDVDRLCRWYAR